MNMKIQDFIDNILEPRLDNTRHTLAIKGKEYANNQDVFHNFNKGAAIDNISPERCLWDYMRKHLVSLQDLIEDPNTRTPEKTDEKIGDVICYLILLEGLLKQSQ